MTNFSSKRTFSSCLPIDLLFYLLNVKTSLSLSPVPFLRSSNKRCSDRDVISSYWRHFVSFTCANWLKKTFFLRSFILYFSFIRLLIDAEKCVRINEWRSYCLERKINKTTKTFLNRMSKLKRRSTRFAFAHLHSYVISFETKFDKQNESQDFERDLLRWKM